MANKPEPEYPYAVHMDAHEAAPGMPSVPAYNGEDSSSIMTGKWEVGFCDCFTHCVPNCCMVFCCPCVSLAQISSRLGMMSYASALILALLIILCTGGFGGLVIWVWVWMARADARERFQIPGNSCADCCGSCCCTCCVMAQLATHIKSYKPGSCDFGPQDTIPAYPSAQTPVPSYA